MTTKVKELDNKRQGDRRSCPICCPKDDRVSESQLWTWAMAQEPPVQPYRTEH